MAIRAILFDLDDTLMVDEAVSKTSLAATAEDARKLGAAEDSFQRDVTLHAKKLYGESPVHPYCKRIGISAFECLWGHFTGDSDDLRSLREWAHAYRRQVFDAALRMQGIESSDGAEMLSARFSKHRRRLQRLMLDAKETIVRLKPRYKLGLLTNGAPDLQREKLAASGLESFFDAIAVSGEHDIGKPETGIFMRLLDELGVHPRDAAMVGNSLERDILGGKNAGVLTIWIKVAGSEEHARVMPDLTILGLAELPDLLEKIEMAAIAPGGV